jgi:hypothetical protein
LPVILFGVSPTALWSQEIICELAITRVLHKSPLLETLNA